jgi:hypothetical protein
VSGRAGWNAHGAGGRRKDFGVDLKAAPETGSLWIVPKSATGSRPAENATGSCDGDGLRVGDLVDRLFL